MANIITQADVDKFLTLLKAGLKHGKDKELKTYSAATKFDGIKVVKDYYVSLEFRFTVDREIIDRFFAEDDFEVSNKIDELLK